MRRIAELELEGVCGGQQPERTRQALLATVEPVSGKGPRNVSDADFARALRACFADAPRCEGVSRNSGEIHEFREGRWGPPGRPI